MDPITIVGGGIQGAVQLAKYLKSVAGTDVISAMFTSDGKRVYGTDHISIHVFPVSTGVWFYRVNDVEGYSFVRMPVIESCAIELVGKLVGETNPDSRIWRWVAPTPPGVIVSGETGPNVTVDFIVVGYRPKALVAQFIER